MLSWAWRLCRGTGGLGTLHKTSIDCFNQF
jgi:hypothetical protein